MDISSLTPGSQTPSPFKTSTAAISQFKAEQANGLLALLPAPSSAPGLGLNLDIYAAVGMQTQGQLAGGRTAIELANISLGIDASQAKDPASSQTTPANGAQRRRRPRGCHSRRHSQSGRLIAPAANPYVIQTDFFAKPNPGLGGQLNSLGLPSGRLTIFPGARESPFA